MSPAAIGASSDALGATEQNGAREVPGNKVNDKKKNKVEKDTKPAKSRSVSPNPPTLQPMVEETPPEDRRKSDRSLKSLLCGTFDFALKVLRSPWLAFALSLSTNFAVLVIEGVLGKGIGVIGVVPFLSVVFTVFVLVMEIVRRQNKFQRVISKRDVYLQLWSAIKYGMVIVYLGLTIGYIVTLVTGTIKNPLSLSHEHLHSLNLLLNNRVAIVVMSIVGMLTNLLVLVHVWEISKKGKVQILIALACIVNFVISVAEIKISTSANTNLAWSDDLDMTALPMLYIYTESFSVSGSLIGLSVAF